MGRKHQQSGQHREQIQKSESREAEALGTGLGQSRIDALANFLRENRPRLPIHDRWVCAQPAGKSSNDIEVILEDGRKSVFRSTLTNFERMFPSTARRVHRSLVCNHEVCHDMSIDRVTWTHRNKIHQHTPRWGGGGAG